MDGKIHYQKTTLKTAIKQNKKKLEKQSKEGQKKNGAKTLTLNVGK